MHVQYIGTFLSHDAETYALTVAGKHGGSLRCILPNSWCLLPVCVRNSRYVAEWRFAPEFAELQREIVQATRGQEAGMSSADDRVKRLLRTMRYIPGKPRTSTFRVKNTTFGVNVSEERFAKFKRQYIGMAEHIKGKCLLHIIYYFVELGFQLISKILL